MTDEIKEFSSEEDEIKKFPTDGTECICDDVEEPVRSGLLTLYFLGEFIDCIQNEGATQNNRYMEFDNTIYVGGFIREVSEYLLGYITVKSQTFGGTDK